MAGAEPAHLERVLPLLELMGTPIVDCGGPGTGTRNKIVNNFVAIGFTQPNAEALSLGAALGLEVERDLKTIAAEMSALDRLGAAGGGLPPLASRWRSRAMGY
ncbi:3-hydroxyisobutyrate dehydrogenase-like beta-hydroxyacid dehydrogenase [Sphingobium sp. OAS761]|uniref:hypothetical protein n=1 Tax=Sphingobium sp. OAS761 TaxID=2817901 RepID=UPI0020A04680|nr:hypothetical protein [Sphingobium sp. OAS761]MCP1471675.1 3-hydroxyisobutyrate dehydrogenase-like beta-hydroxyacid dehydrogenase [Sphingobium sp. OAS761]